jgi:FtsH-binding integral membrane protein
MTTSLNGNKFSFSAMIDFSELTPKIQTHLSKVYGCLLGTILIATIGAMTHIALNIGGLLTTLGVFVLIFLIATTPKHMIMQRVAMLGLLGFFEGASIGPLIDMAIEIDPSIVATALAGATAIFACFTGSALLMKRRSLLYLGGFLMSALTMLIWMSLLNMFIGSMFLFNINLYGGLLLFCGFVAFDTQLVVERFASGDDDFVKHSLTLFLDFVNIFVRILVILMKNSNKKRRK